MSKCNCGQADIPLGMTGMTAGGITHGVTACVSGWAERAEVERLNRIISESKPWIDMADELADAQATIQRVRDVCDLWQRRHDSAIRHPADIPAVAIIAVLRALDGDGDE